MSISESAPRASAAMAGTTTGAGCLRWVWALLTVAAIAGAFVAGGYVLGPILQKGKDHNSNPVAAAPTLYEYYTDGGIVEGLKAGEKDFTLNKKVISLHSGAIHYFRVHPQYWRDRLRKLRAAGFLAVETYVPWNLHEPYDGVFDFGDGGEDMSPFLDIRTFIKTAQEEDLLVIMRPGPYICAEWEFGGLPSWLLKDSSISVRTRDPKYTSRVQKYFDRLLPILKNLQFSTGQGPIIAFQVENEYGNTKESGKLPDTKHLEDIKKMFEGAGLIELFFTSDTPSKGEDSGAIEGVLQTANFNEKAEEELKILKKFQPKKATMVMEFWTGWFDHWGEAHHGMSLENFKTVLEDILKFPSGVNFYMFHGGTTFGFLNGGNVYANHPFFLPDISSYDYDAPLSESGDYTEKYHATIKLLAKYQKVKLNKPELPKETTKVAHASLTAPDILDWNTLLSQVDEEDKQTSKQPLYMEQLNVNKGSGQNFGYIIYRKAAQTLKARSQLQINGTINGAAMVVVDNELQTPPLKTIDDLKNFGYWCSEEGKNILDLQVQSSSSSTVDVIVENWSRNNFGKLPSFHQPRGLTADQIRIDGEVVEDFTIYALQFKGKWVQGLTGWKSSGTKVKGPALLRFKLDVSKPADTFLDMQGWGKGIVFVNGFNLGRYASIGPIHTLFAPAPVFKTGINEICVFEHFTPSSELKFSKTIIFKDADKTFDLIL